MNYKILMVDDDKRIAKNAESILYIEELYGNDCQKMA